MENQNLLFKVPVVDPANELNQACMHIIASRQTDQSGYFTIEEKGKVIKHILKSPTTTQEYEVLEDDDILHAWLHQEALS